MISLVFQTAVVEMSTWGQVAASQASSFRDKGGWPRATFYYLVVALEIPDTQSALITEGAWAPRRRDPTRTLEQTHCNELVWQSGRSLEGPKSPWAPGKLPQYQHRLGPASQPAHSSLPGKSAQPRSPAWPTRAARWAIANCSDLLPIRTARFFLVPLTYLPFAPFTPHRHNRIAHDNVLEHRSSTKPARLHIQPRLVHRVRFLIKVSSLISAAAFQCVHRDTSSSSAPKRQLNSPNPHLSRCLSVTHCHRHHHQRRRHPPAPSTLGIDRNACKHRASPWHWSSSPIHHPYSLCT